MHCNTLQRSATHGKALQRTAPKYIACWQIQSRSDAHPLKSEHREVTRLHCNALQHTATHCNTLQHTATHCKALQRTATHCNALQCTATHCNALQLTATYCTTQQHTATHCNYTNTVLTDPRKREHLEVIRLHNFKQLIQNPERLKNSLVL